MCGQAVNVVFSGGEGGVRTMRVGPGIDTSEGQRMLDVLEISSTHRGLAQWIGTYTQSG